MKLKRFVIPAAMCIAIGYSSVQADDSHHPDKGKTDGPAMSTPETNTGMMDMNQMQERMRAMQQTMDRIHKTDDPDEHLRLMQEHMQQMHEMMGNMRGMMGPGMMIQGGAKGKGGPGQMGNMSMEERQKMMGQRMDMMQGMMEQMMEHMMARQEMAIPGSDDAKGHGEMDRQGQSRMK